MLMLKAAQFVNLALYTLVAGVLWGTWFSLSRSIASITPETFLETGRTMMQNLGGPMSILFPAALLSALPVLVMLFRRRGMAALILASAALALFVVALLATVMVNVPLDEQFRRWTVATLPPDWEAIRDRWQSYHTLRTFASLGGLACAFASALWSVPAAASDRHVSPPR